MKSRSLIYWSQVVCAASVVALSPISSTLAASELAGTADSKQSSIPKQQLLADDNTAEMEETKKRETTTIQRRTTTIERRVQTTTVSTKGESKGFTLAIWQPAGSLSEVTARVSFKGKYGKKFYKERFLGDYKYKIKDKAKFVNGFKAGDRIVVRLYDTANRFIGYSEFECLPGYSTVNLILSANPTEYQVVRTVYGVDNNDDGMIDSGSSTYDYFSQVSNQKVTFFSSTQSIKTSEFQVAEFSQIAQTSVYPASFTQGEFAVVRQTINAFSSDLGQAFTVAPGSLVQVTEISEDSSYELGQLLSEYRQIGVAKGIQVAFSDVSQEYWAKDFIAELAAREIIQGFPDGSFQPDAPMTRAEFAALLQQAFSKSKVRQAISFTDVSRSYWAYTAISNSYQMGFLNVINSREFNPTQSLSRLDILVTLARILNYQASGSTTNILSVFSDASSIRSEYTTLIAALTQRGVIVNYPDVTLLSAEKIATRAEVCALLYKALVSKGELPDISSEYAVKSTEQRNSVEQRTRIEDNDDDDNEGKVRRNCNQGIGNGAEDCDPGKSRPHGGSNDEGGRTPGGRR